MTRPAGSLQLFLHPKLLFKAHTQQNTMGLFCLNLKPDIRYQVLKHCGTWLVSIQKYLTTARQSFPNFGTLQTFDSRKIIISCLLVTDL